ncbi:hypothetical protein [Variovorax sp. CF079]|uniref:hypothetical protein n=1 Tax=Variovorax sp. CF079 TaxID=1882774 RepID=UPI001FCDB7AF|nr:hypothetical protein [Variovorax sp. CF079]
MPFDKVSPGKDAPEAFNVVIEIPMNADPIKYEVRQGIGCDLRRHDEVAQDPCLLVDRAQLWGAHHQGAAGHPRNPDRRGERRSAECVRRRGRTLHHPATSEEARELRQASPLSTVLPQDVRLDIISKVRGLKELSSAEG